MAVRLSSSRCAVPPGMRATQEAASCIIMRTDAHAHQVHTLAYAHTHMHTCTHTHAHTNTQTLITAAVTSIRRGWAAIVYFLSLTSSPESRPHIRIKLSVCMCVCVCVCLFAFMCGLVCACACVCVGGSAPKPQCCI